MESCRGAGLARRPLGLAPAEPGLLDAIAAGLGASPIGSGSKPVEPVSGQIEQARGLRQFLLRGLAKVSAEWALVCAAHNLTKLVRATR